MGNCDVQNQLLVTRQVVVKVGDRFEHLGSDMCIGQLITPHTIERNGNLRDTAAQQLRVP